MIYLVREIESSIYDSSKPKLFTYKGMYKFNKYIGEEFSLPSDHTVGDNIIEKKENNIIFTFKRKIRNKIRTYRIRTRKRSRSNYVYSKYRYIYQLSRLEK